MRSPIRFVLCAMLVGLGSAQPALADKTLPKFDPPPSVQPLPNRINPHAVKLPAQSCPDPAAQRIDFRIIARASRFQGQVEISGVVKNVGQAAYESRPNQQSVHLYEGNRLVAQQAFQNLAPGQEVRVQFVRGWNASSPSEGEFPPTYKLVIVYDPDIRLDGNPKNDDCRGNNDVLQRSGGDINNLFR